MSRVKSRYELRSAFDTAASTGLRIAVVPLTYMAPTPPCQARLVDAMSLHGRALRRRRSPLRKITRDVNWGAHRCTTSRMTRNLSRVEPLERLIRLAVRYIGIRTRNTTRPNSQPRRFSGVAIESTTVPSPCRRGRIGRCAPIVRT